MGDKKKEKKVSKSEAEIIDLKKERDDFKNIAARAQADLVNYRNRMKMELSEIENRGKKTVSLKVLSVIDEFDLDVVLLAGRFTLLDHSSFETFLPKCLEKNVKIILGGPFNSGEDSAAKTVREGERGGDEEAEG